MQPFLIPAKQPLRISSADFGLLDLSLDACPRSYHKELLASFPDCTEALKMRPSCKVLLILAVHKTSMSMASFSPDTGTRKQPALFPDPLYVPASTRPMLPKLSPPLLMMLTRTSHTTRSFSVVSPCCCINHCQVALLLHQPSSLTQHPNLDGHMSHSHLR